MSVETNKAVAREYIEQIWNQHRLDQLERYLSQDLVHHDAPGITDFASAKGFITMAINSVPDFKIDIQNEIAEGDLVVLRTMASGTPQGDFMGIPASGKRFSVAGISILRITGDKITEIWLVNDTIGMMQQLGAIPAMPTG